MGIRDTTDHHDSQNISDHYRSKIESVGRDPRQFPEAPGAREYRDRVQAEADRNHGIQHWDNTERAENSGMTTHATREKDGRSPVSDAGKPARE